MSVAKNSLTTDEPYADPRSKPSDWARSPASGAARHLLGQVVPTLALANFRPQLPPARLRLALDPLEQFLDLSLHSGAVPVFQLEPVQALAADREVAGQRAPQPPVARAQLRDPGRVDRVAVVLGHRMSAEESAGVADILLVELCDLQLGDQQLSERQREWLQLQALGDRNLVRHLEAADEHVDLTLVLVVEEQQPLGSVESVEGHVGLVARAAEQPLSGPGGALRGDEVDVA